MAFESDLTFFVNGVKVVEHNPDPECTLLYYLRKKLRLTGTKLGCAEGGCGACTVMVSRYDHAQEKIHHFSVNACLAPVCSMHGLAVTTVECIGSTKKTLHPIQERLAKSHGSQCGFCTPGIVMSMYTLLRNNPQPSLVDMEKTFEGNLCRCTGYRPILEGLHTFTKEVCCQMGDQCCKVQAKPEEEGIKRTLKCDEEFTAYDPTQEPIFPSELQLTPVLDQASLLFTSPKLKWYRPTNMEELLDLKAQNPDARLVVGNTEVGVETKFKNMVYPVLIAPTHIPRLKVTESREDGLTFGASVTLASMEETLKHAVDNLPEHKTRTFVAVLEMLRWFAGNQVRNVASLAGNIMTASPISDLNPLWMAARCTITALSKARGERKVVMNHEFFLGYRRTVLQPDEVLVSLSVPFTAENVYFYGYKQAHRRDDDIAIVNAGMRVEFEAGSDVVKDLGLAYGGMAPITIMARQTMKSLIGMRWRDELVHKACELLEGDLPLPPGVPGGSELYRRTLTTSFFFKFYLAVLQQLHSRNISDNAVPTNYASAIPAYKRDSSKGSQVFEMVPSGQLPQDPIGRPVVHRSALQQTTGEAKYCDDLPSTQGEIHLGLVWSTKAHAKIVSVDPSAALELPGVVDYIDHTDVPGCKQTGVIQDRDVFAVDKVTCQGSIIGAVLAETQLLAQQAAKAVKVEYEELGTIITIEEAIAAKSFHPPTRTLKNGDVEGAFSQVDHVIEGQVRLGGQEHFYLETHACIAIPSGENSEMNIISSTQDVSIVQNTVASCLGVAAHKIVCRAKRLGGGFGGKETNQVILAVPVAVAAHKHNRPVRAMLDRDEDMVITGGRHPFLGKYKVGFSNEGKVTALSIDIYSNAGNYLDLSYAVMERALFHVENCYQIPNVRVTGYLCKTNIPSNTAFRGFGGPQSMFICETWMTQIANYLGISQNRVRELNLYQEGDKTHYNQVLDNLTIQKCWDEAKVQSDYEKCQAEIETFNRENRWKKRGIFMIPVKFGIAFTAKFLNQAGALVHIYTDGSILVSCSGIEMGQGIYTKMIQIACRVLGVPLDKVHINDTSSDKVPNNSATAASAGSDLNGMAVLNACQILKERLEPYIAANPKGTWDEWVKTAYMDRVGLSTTGFYKTPDLGYDWETNSGNAFHYFTVGAGCSQVEIDCLTGDHTVLRTDIVMDVGSSLNPAIDIGQIEGAFVQGYGLFTLEELRYSHKGFQYTRGPGNYKIPGFTDIPVEFNVSLLRGVTNPRAVFSSKAIGEPPLFLSASVFFAIKSAIAAARREVGLEGDFQLDSPATSERIRMSCDDQFTKQFPAPDPSTYTPWTVLL